MERSGEHSNKTLGSIKYTKLLGVVEELLAPRVRLCSVTLVSYPIYTCLMLASAVCCDLNFEHYHSRTCRDTAI